MWTGLYKAEASTHFGHWRVLILSFLPFSPSPFPLIHLRDLGSAVRSGLDLRVRSSKSESGWSRDTKLILVHLTSNRVYLFQFTPELSDSSTKTSRFLWSCSSTSDCRPSLSCPLQQTEFPLCLTWKRTLGCLSKTWLKQITTDLGTTAADALQLATDRPTWTAVLYGRKATRSMMISDLTSELQI